MVKYEQTGVLSLSDLCVPTKKQLEKGVAITECVQEIPCNPCVDSCPVHAITMKDINAPPVVDYDTCIACGKCVSVCPGLAIFVVKVKEDKAFISLPYEFLPIPKKGDSVAALDRYGEKVDIGVVTRTVKQGKTIVVTISVKKQHAMEVRNIQL